MKKNVRKVTVTEGIMELQKMVRLLLWSQMFVAVVLIGLIVWVLWLMSKLVGVGVL